MVLGVIQEQHAERCGLFVQWKQLSFPIVQDAFTEIGIAVVPVAVLIDEHGQVQVTRPRIDQLGPELNRVIPAPDTAVPRLKPADGLLAAALERVQTEPDSVEARIALGDAYLKWDRPEGIEKAIAAYRVAEEQLPSDSPFFGPLQFRLGVASRFQFDASGGSRTEDFQRAADAWTRALASNPNQYIWRRRIQQYGPGLDKPYPFYDWIESANSEVAARGETPISLTVPLTGSEIAQQQKVFEPAAEGLTHPDPEGKIARDPGQLISIEPTIVPAQPRPGSTVRVYLHFQPKEGKWNNESTPMEIWLEGTGGSSNRRQIELANASAAVSSESRWVEFEFQLDADAQSASIRGFALYNVCESDEGACLYRRQDFTIPLLDD